MYIKTTSLNGLFNATSQTDRNEKYDTKRGTGSSILDFEFLGFALEMLRLT